MNASNISPPSPGSRRIVVMGVGNILFTDEGLGIHAVETLRRQYAFPPHVSLVDGGVLGLNLLGVITEADVLIVLDAVRNGGRPGDLYRLAGEEIPLRFRAKNSLHQVDLLEALLHAEALEASPDTVILGMEPQDIETVGLELSPAVQARMKGLLELTLIELGRHGVHPHRIPGEKGEAEETHHVFGHSSEGY